MARVACRGRGARVACRESSTVIVVRNRPPKRIGRRSGSTSTVDELHRIVRGYTGSSGDREIIPERERPPKDNAETKEPLPGTRSGQKRSDVSRWTTAPWSLDIPCWILGVHGFTGISNAQQGTPNAQVKTPHLHRGFFPGNWEVAVAAGPAPTGPGCGGGKVKSPAASVERAPEDERGQTGGPLRALFRALFPKGGAPRRPTFRPPRGKPVGTRPNCRHAAPPRHPPR